MLVECNIIQDFWAKAINWWNHQCGNYYTVDVLSILYGYSLAEKNTITFNYSFRENIYLCRKT